MKPDTIVALASGAGRAGIAMIRLSGPAAGATLRALTDRDVPPPRQAARRAFCDPATGLSLDDGLALWFPGPASFTGEDVAELHVHGGPAVIAAIIDACLGQAGVRPAEPGEFTRRAFEHGKLDLAEAEGLADLVDAETEGQRRQALRQRRGALSAVYESWRAKLIEASALIEAEIDFPDDDLPGALALRARPILTASSPGMRRPVKNSNCAFWMPTNLGSVRVRPKPGWKPRRLKFAEKRASGQVTRKSAVSAKPRPPPMAAP